eukprot:NODE_187_length_15673_cov_0.222743.p5 type:complete len:223 gc:universal NODE_187_length_15673_cov_0.222743:6837-6169(-)
MIDLLSFTVELYPQVFDCLIQDYLQVLELRPQVTQFAQKLLQQTFYMAHDSIQYISGLWLSLVLNLKRNEEPESICMDYPSKFLFDLLTEMKSKAVTGIKEIRYELAPFGLFNLDTMVKGTLESLDLRPCVKVCIKTEDISPEILIACRNQLFEISGYDISINECFQPDLTIVMVDRNQTSKLEDGTLTIGWYDGYMINDDKSVTDWIKQTNKHMEEFLKCE